VQLTCHVMVASHRLSVRCYVTVESEDEDDDDEDDFSDVVDDEDEDDEYVINRLTLQAPDYSSLHAQV
jgi:hypothetical protein